MEKTFEVSLSKIYKIQIKAHSKDEAKRFSEFYTGDVLDISTVDEQIKNMFQIEEIECVENEAFECEEVK